MASILFDFDGTLIDSVGGMARAGNALLRELGRDTVDETTYSRFVGRGIAVQLRDLLDHTGGREGLDEGILLDRLHALYNADPVTGTVLFDGAGQALRSLRDHGHSLALVTQKPEVPTHILLRALALDALFDAVTTGDSYPFLKPDPRMISQTVAHLPPRARPVLFVGDSEVDAKTAHAAGVPFLLRHGGYHNGDGPGQANAVFHDFAELPGIVEQVLSRG